jgi:hypothetical protein
MVGAQLPSPRRRARTVGEERKRLIVEQLHPKAGPASRKLAAAIQLGDVAIQPRTDRGSKLAVSPQRIHHSLGPIPGWAAAQR